MKSARILHAALLSLLGLAILSCSSGDEDIARERLYKNLSDKVFSVDGSFSTGMRVAFGEENDELVIEVSAIEEFDDASMIGVVAVGGHQVHTISCSDVGQFVWTNSISGASTFLDEFQMRDKPIESLVDNSGMVGEKIETLPICPNHWVETKESWIHMICRRSRDEGALDFSSAIDVSQCNG